MTVGQAAASPLGHLKVTGTGRFPPDYPASDGLHVAVLRSQVPHARIDAIDISRASSMEGVVALVTRSDLGMDDVVRHCGDVIAAVAAENADLARDAVDEIDVGVTRLPVVDDIHVALSSEVRLAPGSDSNVSLEIDHTVGDVEGALTGAVFVHEATYRTGRPTHNNLSRRACVARLGEDGILEVMASVDAPFFARAELAHALGLPEERIRIVLPELLTSSFGGRSSINRQCEPIAGHLAMRAGGRPVRLVHDPEEEFLAGTTRHPMTARLVAAADEAGRLVALDIDVVADHGPYSDFVSRIVLSASRDRPLDLYSVENYRFRGRSVLTNNLPAGEMRGIGATQICHILGVHTDELARKIGLDPLDFHERNLAVPARVSLSECFRRGRDVFAARSEGDRSTGVGVGIGCHTTGLGTFHGPDRAAASATLERDGTVTIGVGAPDSGQGSATIWTQISAHELSIPFGLVSIAPIDTTSAPDDQWGSIASRSTYVVGSAVKLAAERLKARIDDIAGDDSPWRAAGTEVGVPAAAVVDALGKIGRDHAPIRVIAEAVTEDTPPTYGAYFAEVEVDPQTGVVTVRRFVAALDVGFAVNPAQCRGQIEGAVALGLEFALGAEVILRHAIPENANLVDYRVALATDMPEIDVVLVETAERSGPYGARGIGTPALTPVMPAIANAVRDAIGWRPSAIPMHPESLLAATRDNS